MRYVFTLIFALLGIAAFVWGDKLYGEGKVTSIFDFRKHLGRFVDIQVMIVKVAVGLGLLFIAAVLLWK